MSSRLIINKCWGYFSRILVPLLFRVQHLLLQAPVCVSASIKAVVLLKAPVVETTVLLLHAVAVAAYIYAAVLLLLQAVALASGN
jgi:hypothetical protein